MTISVGVSTLHPVVTSGGTVVATVTHPPGDPLGAVAILPGWLSMRGGPNRVWARAAEKLAGAGFTVLRPDYPGVGESDPLPRGVDRTTVVAEAFEWFSSITDGAPLRIVGWCHGARLALRLSVHGIQPERLILLNPDLRRYLSQKELDVAVRRILAPPFRAMFRAAGRGVPGRGGRPRPWDRRLVDALAHAARATEVHVVVGERHWAHADVATVEPEIRARGGRFLLEPVPGLTFDSFRSGPAQEELIARVHATVTRLDPR